MRSRFLVVALAVTIAACTGSDPDGGSSDATAASSTVAPSSTAPPTDSSSTTTTTTEPPPPAVATDFGVDDDEIRVGASADLTGPRAQVTAAMIDGQIAFFDTVNSAGGIADRRITLVVRDHASDTDTHVDNYTELAEQSEAGVAILSATGDEEQTTAILVEMAADSLVGVTSSSAVRWATSRGSAVLELGATTCVEAMNGVEFLLEYPAADEGLVADDDSVSEDAADPALPPPTLAIVSRLGPYGQEGAAGARHAATELGLEIVADLDGSVGPTEIADITESLIEADPDLVWVTVSPPELAQLIVGATAGGLDARWAGNSPSYNSALLATAAAPVLSDRYLHSALTEQWGTDTPAMQTVMDTLAAELPDGTYDEADAYLAGWLQASAVSSVLEEAAAAEDMTRVGIAAAAERLTVNLAGVAPSQSWNTGGDAFVRQTYLYDIGLDGVTLDRTLRQVGSTGLNLLAGPYEGSVATAAAPVTACGPNQGI